MAVLLVPLPDAIKGAEPGANKFFEAMRVIELPLALFAGDAALVLIGVGRFSLDAALRIEDRWRKKKTAAEAAVMSAPHS